MSIEAKMQGLIDSNGYKVAELEKEGPSWFSKEEWKGLRQDQATLKRALGELMRLRRENKALHDFFEFHEDVREEN